MDHSGLAPFLKLLKRVIAGGMLGTGALVAASIEPNEGEVKIYVEQNLEELINLQEKTLGITYHQKNPLIHYSIPPDKTKFGTPLATYDYETNRIYLRSRYLDPPEWDLSAAKDTINHELAHYYMDKLSEELVNRSYPHYEDGMSLAEMLGIKLISEGAATYIERRMNEQPDTFTDEDWPKSIQGFVFHPLMPYPKNEIIYNGGFHLVKPIIDHYGEKGIIYLMFNPPHEQEMLSLPLYQQRMLEELFEHE